MGLEWTQLLVGLKPAQRLLWSLADHHSQGDHPWSPSSPLPGNPYPHRLLWGFRKPHLLELRNPIGCTGPVFLNQTQRRNRLQGTPAMGRSWRCLVPPADHPGTPGMAYWLVPKPHSCQCPWGPIRPPLFSGRMDSGHQPSSFDLSQHKHRCLLRI